MKSWLLGLCVLIAGLTLAPQRGGADGPTLEERLNDAFDAGALPGLHGVLVMRDGDLFAEAYFKGQDQRWGQEIGLRQHGPDTLHDLRSVTKSIVGLLYGIALEQDLVPALDAPLLAQFPNYADLRGDPAREAITVRDALNMTMGTKWNEDLPYTNPRNSEIAMERAPDPIRYVLEQEMVGEPGRSWVYNGGATALIGHMIARGANERLEVYADRVLFAPLGITEFEWVNGARGTASAASGLRMSARDLARLGRMIEQGGQVNGRQIVPSAWLEAIFTPQASAVSGLRYSQFWWLAPEGDPPIWVAGFGNGGQRLMINRAAGVVLVVFAGNYNYPDDWKLPVKVTTDFVIPALR